MSRREDNIEEDNREDNQGRIFRYGTGFTGFIHLTSQVYFNETNIYPISDFQLPPREIRNRIRQSDPADNPSVRDYNKEKKAYVPKFLRKLKIDKEDKDK